MTKKIRILIPIFLILFFGLARSNSYFSNSLVGEWILEDKSGLRFIFSDNEIKIIIPTINSNLILRGNYLSDSSRIVNTIDIKNIDKISYSLHGIYKHIGKNKIKISKFSKKKKTRPLSFEKNNYYTLIRRNK